MGFPNAGIGLVGSSGSCRIPVRRFFTDRSGDTKAGKLPRLDSLRPPGFWLLTPGSLETSARSSLNNRANNSSIDS
jgi:hypothetical protein